MTKSFRLYTWAGCPFKRWCFGHSNWPRDFRLQFT